MADNIYISNLDMAFRLGEVSRRENITGDFLNPEVKYKPTGIEIEVEGDEGTAQAHLYMATTGLGRFFFNGETKRVITVGLSTPLGIPSFKKEKTLEGKSFRRQAFEKVLIALTGIAKPDFRVIAAGQTNDNQYFYTTNLFADMDLPALSVLQEENPHEYRIEELSLIYDLNSRHNQMLGLIDKSGQEPGKKIGGRYSLSLIDLRDAIMYGKIHRMALLGSNTNTQWFPSIHTLRKPIENGVVWHVIFDRSKLFPHNLPLAATAVYNGVYPHLREGTDAKDWYVYVPKPQKGDSEYYARFTYFYKKQEKPEADED